MKKIGTAFLALSISFFLTAQNKFTPLPKLSAGAMQYLWKLEHQSTELPYVFPGYVYRTDAQNKLYISAMVQVQPGFNEQALQASGARVNTQAGNIWTVQVPVENVQQFVQTAGIQYIEMDQPVAPCLDSARVAARVDSVHAGYGLPQPYTGKNVVVGIIDAGFDYTHPALYDTAYNNYRVKRVWEEKTTGTPPAGFSYGQEYADSALIHAKLYDQQIFSHGTHVAGIAAGSGYGGDSTQSAFRGMAYQSDLVLVGIAPSLNYWKNTGMADMLDGAAYVYNYAQSVGKPAVVNLSWGGPIGPHDGQSLFSQALDNLTGPGRIFTASAGNNGTNRVHLKKVFTPADTTVSTIVVFNTSLPQKTNLVDIWGDSAQAFCIQLSLYTGASKMDSSIFFCLDNSTHLIQLKGLNGDTCFVTLTSVASEFNGKPHMLLDIYSRVNDRICLTVKAGSGTVNMWQGYVLENSGYYGSFSKLSYSFASNGDSAMQVGDIACTRSAIAVGAYNSKVSFKNVSGQNIGYNGYVKGNIASFSSHGPSADGRTKPDITGPGMALASAVNSADSSFVSGGVDYNLVASKFVSPRNGQTYSYAMLQGTSMSGPAVAGIVALMLEVNPNLTPATVKNILAQTAITDNFTGTLPASGSNTWGFGKVNAYQAVKKTLETTGIFHSESPISCLVYPNPNQGIYNIQYTALQPETIHIRLYNTSGNELWNESWQTSSGVNTRQISLSAYPSGIYLTHITSSSGSALVRIIKQ